MKVIGIIGGLGPPSTVKYYERLNEGAAKALGGAHAAKIIISSVDGEQVRQLRLAGDPDAEGAFYAREAQRLEQAGADFILIASNTSHKNAPYIEKAISIPLLHLADATAAAVKAAGMTQIALLGTALTMESAFYKERLEATGLRVIIPDETDRAFMTEAIYTELVKGQVRGAVRSRFAAILEDMREKGAQGAILGCTELTLLDLAELSDLPLFDTVDIHVAAALKKALS